MNTIHILPEALASKIAAGEVVQRPASAVKELVENAVDAGATSMTIIIKQGGKSFIQVIDNGCGLSGEDAAVAFERHATSKISTYEDLENIRTLGFRGEALASIAAVAQIELRTRQKTDDVGTVIRIDGGEKKGTTKDAMDYGTSIIVRNLFYNTPGRRNFLKANNTEFKHVFDVVQRLAIAHPEYRINFASDDDNVLDLRPSSADERIKDLFGERQYESLVSFRDSNENVEINGYVSKPDFSRKTRVEQYLFLNGRYIVNRSINHAVFQSYEHLLEKGSFPFFILFLTIAPHRVDVNVHPSKMEVKFEDERSIYRMVVNSVRKALMAHDLVPSLAKADYQDSSAPPRTTYGGPIPVHSWQDLLGPKTLEGVDSQTGEILSGAELPGFRQSEVPSKDAEQFSIPQAPFPTPHFPVWQLQNKYIISPTREGLMVVDQHVAHERVLYERTVERSNAQTRTSQQLLFPQTLDLVPGDAALVRQLIPHLEGMGFVLKFFGKTTVVVEAVPPDVRPNKETTILQDIIDLYKENEHDVKLEPRENLAKSFSCKAAIKAGDPLNEQEMQSLLGQLFTTKNPFVCPHGRPVIVKLSLKELDKRFGRPV